MTQENSGTVAPPTTEPEPGPGPLPDPVPEPQPDPSGPGLPNDPGNPATG